MRPVLSPALSIVLELESTVLAWRHGLPVSIEIVDDIDDHTPFPLPMLPYDHPHIMILESDFTDCADNDKIIDMPPLLDDDEEELGLNEDDKRDVNALAEYDETDDDCPQHIYLWHNPVSPTGEADPHGFNSNAMDDVVETICMYAARATTDDRTCIRPGRRQTPAHTAT
ncbi:hypothetical protein C8R46DRAFT_1223167 [Mycena filopes]|nr:hypothetical protein C8R46DRAFT_1223167 [Mycena filopes]